LQRRIDEVDRLYGVASAERDGERTGTDKADAADNELAAISKRIFASRPITLHNLKQRAVLARYWHRHRPDGEAWKTPHDCDAWEDQVMAHLIQGVLDIGTPPA